VDHRNCISHLPSRTCGSARRQLLDVFIRHFRQKRKEHVARYSCISPLLVPLLLMMALRKMPKYQRPDNSPFQALTGSASWCSSATTAASIYHRPATTTAVSTADICGISATSVLIGTTISALSAAGML
jgi:hypothetical protein